MGVLLLVAFWLVTLIWGLASKANVAVSQANEAQANYAALEMRKVKLQADLDALASERGQDAAIRTAFGVARPGEELIVVVPPTAPTSTPPKSWWQKLFSWF
jgi:cell division protein FtsB